VLVSTLALAAQVAFSLVPQPVSLQPKDGTFTIRRETYLVVSAETERIGRQFQHDLGEATGMDLDLTRGGSHDGIHLRIDKKLKRLGAEGYTLSVKPNRVDVVGSSLPGLFYGIQTLKQLMPSAIYRRAPIDTQWIIPCVEIEDQPRFGWRGTMLDVARHYMPKEFILKYIDVLAMHKMNRLHLHLTDDQGWRIEIKRYPKLTEIGSERADSMLTYSPATYAGKPHRGYYTQDDLKEIVAYAANRFVEVIPEIEMPGHASAAIAAYPELGNLPNPMPVPTKWGVISDVFNVEDSTIKFLQNVLDEVITIFPSKFIHIGGDECPKDQWKKSAQAQARMKAEGLKTEEELQSWFIRQMDKHLDSKGRRLIGWSEILEGGLAPGAALMVWLGDDGAMEAVESGHDVVMAQTSHTYFDYYQSKDLAKEPHAIGGYLPLKQVYAYDPVLPAMTAEHAKHVLGVQYQTWTEYIRDGKHVEYMAFPRACALAEVAWSPKANRNYESFLSRLPSHLERLRAKDVNFRALGGPEPVPVGTWSPNQVGTDHRELVWPLAAVVRRTGTYQAEFQFTGGSHRLDIAWVELLEDGKPISRDEHAGRAGAETRANLYKLSVKTVKPKAKYALRAKVRADGGADSHGEVFFRGH